MKLPRVRIVYTFIINPKTKEKKTSTVAAALEPQEGRSVFLGGLPPTFGVRSEVDGRWEKGDVFPERKN